MSENIFSVMFFGEYSTQIEHIAVYESSDDNDGMFFSLKLCPIFVGSASLHFTKYKIFLRF